MNPVLTMVLQIVIGILASGLIAILIAFSGFMIKTFMDIITSNRAVKREHEAFNAKIENLEKIFKCRLHEIELHINDLIININEIRINTNSIKEGLKHEKTIN